MPVEGNAHVAREMREPYNTAAIESVKSHQPITVWEMVQEP
jgi:hypothetical protein